MVLSGRTILVIDDEEDFSYFLKRNFERFNCKIITAKEGAEGFKLALEHKPDLILLDIMMPGMDGFEVLKKLKANQDTQPIPVVVLTGRDDEDSRKKAEILRHDDYVVKPVEVEALKARIEKALTGYLAKERTV